ncbi:hypothetical protein H0H93_016823 [Arthromyces matolae]|nr:hypothetical protein H0H93_016823 [Arthromyces matolae]
MLKLSASLIALALAVSPVIAQSALYGQCGGINWTGATTCVSGSVCTYQNPYYSQCLPGTTTTGATTSTTSTSSTSKTTTTTTTNTSTTKTTSTSTTSTSTSTSASATSTVTGFVKTSGTKFTLNGSTYTVVG